ncbi:unnamed protein product [Gongylonema pulchrum]|uniref:TPR_REGION domain-containing protein n=1 Tax=Gongylonema pulchrum TaxID=637853 RepID=A0A183ERX5_9BILA|nr:unnamed protein product [Gongylonema pulchrum]
MTLVSAELEPLIAAKSKCNFFTKLSSLRTRFNPIKFWIRRSRDLDNRNQYHALARCIELSWRRGDVEQAEKYLKNALDANPRATVDAGFNYCKGLHEWCAKLCLTNVVYSGEPNAALQAFNRARRDLEWGERAIYNMIEICLNPDNEIIGGEVFDYNQDSNPFVFLYEYVFAFGKKNVNGLKVQVLTFKVLTK